MENINESNIIPSTLPTTGQDIFNFLAGFHASNHQLHIVLSFDGHIDEIFLAKAVRLTLDIEPVLGCRFVEQPDSTYWARRSDLDDVLNICSLCETEDVIRSLKEFIAIETDSRHDPLVQVKILRSLGQDTLCIKMDHACVDGGGLKEYTYLLCDIYNHLCSGRIYPVKTVMNRPNGGNYLKEQGIDDPLKAFNPALLGPPPTWSFPSMENKNQYPAYLMKQLDKEQFIALKRYAQQHSVTINDILLTAYYRALFKITATPENELKSVLLSIDLRRQIPEGSNIRVVNFSSSFNVLFSHMVQESFSATLKRVNQLVSELKNGHGEIPIAAFFELFTMNYSAAKAGLINARENALKTKFSSPLLSNVGIINLVSLGNCTAVEGYIVTPAMFAPGFMLGVSTYNNVLTLVVNYYTSDINKELVSRFLDSMFYDIISLV